MTMWPLGLAVVGLASTQSVSRRAVLGAVAAGAALPHGMSSMATARVPGSENVGEAVEQIIAGRESLVKLQKEWATYACVDKEGRACNIDAARKILGGVAPQRGEAAIEVAKVTPLYRIDNAFAAVRKFSLNDEDGWGSKLDVEAFVEKSDDVVFALKKTDDSFYGVVFASKGSTMIEGIYAEAKKAVDKSVVDLDTLLAQLKDVGCPYV